MRRAIHLPCAEIILAALWHEHQKRNEMAQRTSDQRAKPVRSGLGSSSRLTIKSMRRITPRGVAKPPSLLSEMLLRSLDAVVCDSERERGESESLLPTPSPLAPPGKVTNPCSPQIILYRRYARFSGRSCCSDRQRSRCLPEQSGIRHNLYSILSQFAYPVRIPFPPRMHCTPQCPFQCSDCCKAFPYPFEP